MQRSILGVVRIFMTIPPYTFGTYSRVVGAYPLIFS